MRRKIIVVTGLPGSGKSEVSRDIKRRRITTFITGNIIKEEVSRRGLELTLESQEYIARELRKEYGPDAPINMIEHRIRDSKSSIICVDGPRNIKEVELLEIEQQLSSFGPKVRELTLSLDKANTFIADYAAKLTRREQEVASLKRELTHTQALLKKDTLKVIFLREDIEQLAQEKKLELLDIEQQLSSLEPKVKGLTLSLDKANTSIVKILNLLTVE